jgi:Insertion element 4 transposase N-terminal/Transposase DDE domain
VKLDSALEAVAAYADGDRLEGLKRHIDPVWIEEALEWSGTVTLRRRRLPAEQVLWLVIGMGLMRAAPIERVVDALELALPDRKRTLVAKSAISQARKRLSDDPLAYLFTVSAAEWSGRSADSHRWRDLALYGMDGTTMRVADTTENRAAFGGQKAGGGRGESGYPQVRVVAMMALRSHVLSAFRFADYATGETTLARGIWNEVPENSLVIVDRNFLVKKDLIHLETSGNRHWLSRSKVNTKWAISEKLGKDDYLVEWDVHETGLPSTWTLRAIHYKKKGFPRATLLTSLLDPEKYPAKELIALYHERWETELGYDELKTHLLDRQESIRSKTPEGVRQELWGIALAYNLVRVEMEKAAAEAGVPPTRISFVASLAMIRDEFMWLGSPRVTPGAIPASLARLRRQLKRLVLPPRRPERSYPRAVKVKMSNYPRKRPAKRDAK